MFSKYSIYMLATTGEHGEPIAAPCKMANILPRDGTPQVIVRPFGVSRDNVVNILL